MRQYRRTRFILDAESLAPSISQRHYWGSSRPHVSSHGTRPSRAKCGHARLFRYALTLDVMLITRSASRFPKRRDSTSRRDSILNRHRTNTTNQVAHPTVCKGRGMDRWVHRKNTNPVQQSTTIPVDHYDSHVANCHAASWKNQNHGCCRAKYSAWEGSCFQTDAETPSQAPYHDESCSIRPVLAARQ